MKGKEPRKEKVKVVMDKNVIIISKAMRDCFTKARLSHVLDGLDSLVSKKGNFYTVVFQESVYNYDPVRDCLV